MAERPSPERTAELAATVRTLLHKERHANGPYRFAQEQSLKPWDAALAALDELVAVLAAETARANEWKRAYEDSMAFVPENRAAAAEAERDALAARLEQLRGDAKRWLHNFNIAEAEIERLTERDDWMRRQIDGVIEAAEAVAFACGLATARAVVGDLKDFRAALAALQEAPPPDTRRYAQTGVPATWQPETPTLGGLSEAPPNGKAT